MQTATAKNGGVYIGQVTGFRQGKAKDGSGTLELANAFGPNGAAQFYLPKELGEGKHFPEGVEFKVTYRLGMRAGTMATGKGNFSALQTEIQVISVVENEPKPGKSV